jgi:hypothetical protein
MGTLKFEGRAVASCDIRALTDADLDQVTGGGGTEQSLNIGSQSSGAGAGKVTFNPFSITRKIDKASPIFFQSN